MQFSVDIDCYDARARNNFYELTNKLYIYTYKMKQLSCTLQIDRCNNLCLQFKIYNLNEVKIK